MSSKPPKEEKPAADRLTEGVSILKQLREAGVKDTVMSFQVLKQQISEWVKTGEPWEGRIDFPEYGRVAVVALPRYTNRAAELTFKKAATRM
jgi:hypothetical protein